LGSREIPNEFLKLPILFYHSNNSQDFSHNKKHRTTSAAQMLSELVSGLIGIATVDTTAIYANFDGELLYQDFGHKKLVIKDIQNALLRNNSLNAVTVA